MNWKVSNTPFRKGSKGSNGVKACNWIKNVCSKHSLNFVKKILCFFLFLDQGYWEDNSAEAHEQWPKKCSMAIVATGWGQKRRIGNL